MSKEDILRFIVEDYYKKSDGSSGTSALDKFLGDDEMYDWKLSYLANQLSEDYPEDHEDEPDWAKDFLMEYFEDIIEEILEAEAKA